MTHGTREELRAGKLRVYLYTPEAEVGEAAAENAASVLSRVIREKGRARAVFATSNSQLLDSRAASLLDLSCSRAETTEND